VVALTGTTSATAASSTSAAAPGLTSYGRIVWNFEGLLTRTLGSAYACEAAHGNPSLNWTRSACNLANAFQVPWQPVFARHTATTFTTTTTHPPDLGNTAPIRIAGRYVLCAPNTWLVENSLGGWLCTTP
jgi:hypothetical protein